MEYFLGIDIGTTSVKSIAFSREGKIISAHSVSYPILHPHPDRSEQDPEEIFNAVIKTVENIIRDLSPFLPLSCGFCSAMHSLIAVDKNGNAISPSIIWADNRAAGVARHIHEENRALSFYTRTGLPVHAMSPFCKLLWIKKNQPELFEKAHKFIGIKEYVFFKLFGTYSIDVSMASATGLMNKDSRQWDEWILKETGLGAEKLSEIVGIDKIFTSPGLLPALHEIPFIIGGSDGAMANIGASGEPGSLVVTIGTSSAARLIVSEHQIDPAMRTFCYYLKKHQWLVGGASNNGGIVLQWLIEDFFKSENTMDHFLDLASTVEPGAGDLIFVPYLLGERAPIWNADAKAILFGLRIDHGQAAMIRASVEGIIYCLYAISLPLMERSDIRYLYASGGFLRNELCCKLWQIHSIFRSGFVKPSKILPGCLQMRYDGDWNHRA
jgi:gluconokinase